MKREGLVLVQQLTAMRQHQQTNKGERQQTDEMGMQTGTASISWRTERSSLSPVTPGLPVRHPRDDAWRDMVSRHQTRSGNLRL